MASPCPISKFERLSNAWPNVWPRLLANGSIFLIFILALMVSLITCISVFSSGSFLYFINRLSSLAELSSEYLKISENACLNSYLANVDIKDVFKYTF